MPGAGQHGLRVRGDQAGGPLGQSVFQGQFDGRLAVVASVQKIDAGGDRRAAFRARQPRRRPFAQEALQQGVQRVLPPRVFVDQPPLGRQPCEEVGRLRPAGQGHAPGTVEVGQPAHSQQGCLLLRAERTEHLFGEVTHHRLGQHILRTGHRSGPPAQPRRHQRHAGRPATRVVEHRIADRLRMPDAQHVEQHFRFRPAERQRRGIERVQRAIGDEARAGVRRRRAADDHDPDCRRQLGRQHVQQQLEERGVLAAVRVVHHDAAGHGILP